MSFLRFSRVESCLPFVKSAPWGKLSSWLCSASQENRALASLKKQQKQTPSLPIRAGASEELIAGDGDGTFRLESAEQERRRSRKAALWQRPWNTRVEEGKKKRNSWVGNNCSETWLQNNIQQSQLSNKETARQTLPAKKWLVGKIWPFGVFILATA